MLCSAELRRDRTRGQSRTDDWGFARPRVVRYTTRVEKAGSREGLATRAGLEPATAGSTIRSSSAELTRLVAVTWDTWTLGPEGWSGWPDSNRRPRRPERRALPSAPQPVGGVGTARLGREATIPHLLVQSQVCCPLHHSRMCECGRRESNSQMDRVHRGLSPARLPVPPRPPGTPRPGDLGAVDPDGLEPSPHSVQGSCTAARALGPGSAGQESNLLCPKAPGLRPGAVP